MQKFELLLDIANSVIEQLFLTLIIPFMRQYVMPVICYILMSVQNDPTVFHKILPRIPKVLKQIELSISATSNMDSDIRENHQRLVDLIYTLRQHYSVTDGRYKELVRNNCSLNCLPQLPQNANANYFSVVCLGRALAKIYHIIYRSRYSKCKTMALCVTDKTKRTRVTTGS